MNNNLMKSQFIMYGRGYFHSPNKQNIYKNIFTIAKKSTNSQTYKNIEK